MVEMTMTDEIPQELLDRIVELGKGLNERQKMLVLAKVKGANGVQAAKLAGYPGNTSDAPRVLANERVRSYMSAMLEAAGIDDASIARRLRQGMDAMRVELTRDGTPKELGPDWQNRTKVLELALKVKGAFPDPKLQLTGADGGAIVVRHTHNLGQTPD